MDYILLKKEISPSIKKIILIKDLKTYPVCKFFEFHSIEMNILNFIFIYFNILYTYVNVTHIIKFHFIHWFHCCNLISS